MDLVQAARDFGLPVALLLAAVWGFATGRVFSRAAYMDMRAELSRERDDWKTIALRATSAAERSVALAEPLVKGPGS